VRYKHSHGELLRAVVVAEQLDGQDKNSLVAFVRGAKVEPSATPPKAYNRTIRQVFRFQDCVARSGWLICN